MTIDRAYYHKLMLEVGLTESFDCELDKLLEQEDPLSELTLDLSICGGNRNEQIHILNDFVCSVPKEQIDSDAVFSLVASDILNYCEKTGDDLEGILRRVHSVAESSEFEADEPWHSLWSILFLYDDIELGWTTETKIRETLTDLLRNRTPLFEPLSLQPAEKRQSLTAYFKRLFTLIRR